jgi:hypothetical protein
MLGINTPEDKEPKPYRNYVAVNPGDGKYIVLERLGLVECYRRSGPSTEYDWYKCTDKGTSIALISHKHIRYNKPRRRYLKYLEISDCLPDLTFKEFLTSPDFRETRRRI